MEKPSEGQNPPEQKETDYLSIFQQRLQEIGPTSEDDLRFDGYENAQVGKIEKEIPAIVIRQESDDEYELGDWELWITDPAIIKDGRAPHEEVKLEFSQISGHGKIFRRYCISAWVLENIKGELSLLVDDDIGKDFQKKDFKKEDDLKFLEFLRKYNISKVVGFFPDESGENINKGITVINEDMIATSREDLYLLNIAQEHGMTNNQFLRLRQRAHSARDAQMARPKDSKEAIIRFDAEKIAKEIIEEEGYL